MELPIVTDQTYAAPPADVWNAITDPSRMRQWFFEGTAYRHHWNVLEVVPRQRLVYRWRYDGSSGDG